MADSIAQRAPQRAAQRPPQRRVIYTGENKFKFDESRVPDGYEYAWKRVSIAGMEDTEHKIMCELNGWTHVPANRHPELTGHRSGEEPIIRGGQMLMEQPTDWAQESRKIDEFAAKHTLEEQIMRLGLQSKAQGGKGVKRTMDTIGELVE